jgi:hypothetical protein
MTVTCTRLPILVSVFACILAFGASSALASLSEEVNSGKATAARIDAGAARCENLSTTDFEHLGEYVMERTVGSRSAHEAMNARMEAMIGSANSDRMHEAIGRRYAGCATSGTGSGMMGGTGMMGATGGWSTMLGSGYAWMRDGAWLRMTRADWRRAGGYMMGQGWMTDGGGSGWSSDAIIAAVLGALALGGLAVHTLRRRQWRRGPSRPSPA